jgi:hypothetical protein
MRSIWVGRADKSFRRMKGRGNGGVCPLVLTQSDNPFNFVSGLAGYVGAVITKLLSTYLRCRARTPNDLMGERA